MGAGGSPTGGGGKRPPAGVNLKGAFNGEKQTNVERGALSSAKKRPLALHRLFVGGSSESARTRCLRLA